MNFFKSVFIEEPGDPNSTDESVPETPQDSDSTSSDPPKPNVNSNSNSAWSFEGLMRTLSTKSESVIQTYSRDLMEFGSGLRKEIEVAQGSLGNVGHAFDEFGNAVIKGTTQIISHGKDVINLATDHDSDSSESSRSSYGSSPTESLRRYSRFHAQLRVIQDDVNTYCEEPEDLDEYTKWKSGFVLEDKNQEISSLFEENLTMESVYKRVVPSTIDHETFWCRYFYKVHKLKQTEDVRAKLKKAISTEEEELSWDFDDNDTDDEKTVKESDDTKIGRKMKDKDSGVKESGKREMAIEDGKQTGSDQELKNGNIEKSIADSEKIPDVNNDGKGTRRPLIDGSEAKKSREDTQNEGTKEGNVGKSVPGNSDIDHGKIKKGDDAGNAHKEIAPEAFNNGVAEKDVLESKDFGTEKKESESKSVKMYKLERKGDPEEDFGWDEIEDLCGDVDEKAAHDGKPNRVEVKKKLTAAEEEEDLSWDIEDDD